MADKSISFKYSIIDGLGVIEYDEGDWSAAELVGAVALIQDAVLSGVGARTEVNPTDAYECDDARHEEE